MMLSLTFLLLTIKGIYSSEYCGPKTVNFHWSEILDQKSILILSLSYNYTFTRRTMPPHLSSGSAVEPFYGLFCCRLFWGTDWRNDPYIEEYTHVLIPHINRYAFIIVDPFLWHSRFLELLNLFLFKVKNASQSQSSDCCRQRSASYGQIEWADRCICRGMVVTYTFYHNTDWAFHMML